MLPFLAAVALAFGAIFIAEFGDKSQLLILAFASRYAARPVVLGLVLAAAAIQGVSVAVGAAAGATLPHTAVAIVSGVAFLAVAAWTLRGARDDNEALRESARADRQLAGAALVLTVAATFIVSELGDKTMLATSRWPPARAPFPRGSAQRPARSRRTWWRWPSVGTWAIGSHRGWCASVPRRSLPSPAWAC